MEEGTFLAPPGAHAQPPASVRDRTGAVKVAAGLNLAWGGLFVVAGIVAAMVLSTIAEAARRDFEYGAAQDLEMARSIVLAVSLLLGAPYVVGGVAVFYRRNWGRVMLLAMSGLGLLMVPLGTIVAATSLWALTRPGSETWFGGGA